MYILYCFLEVPDSMAAAPELNQFMLEFDLGRLCGMTLYEILSLAINLAILILTALSRNSGGFIALMWRRPTESGISFLLIYYQLALSSNLLQFTQNKKSQSLLDNNLYKIKYIYYTDFWKCLILWRRLPNSTSLCWNLI